MRKIQKQFVQSTLVATAALVLLATQSQAEASDFEGKIDTLRLDPGSSGARVPVSNSDERPLQGSKAGQHHHNGRQVGSVTDSDPLPAQGKVELLVSGTTTFDNFVVRSVRRQ